MSRKILPSLLALALALLATPADAKKRKLDGRPYFLHVPPGVEEPALLVWCHPGDGRAKPGFKWWRKQAAFRKGGDTILLAPQAAARGWSMERDAGFVLELVDRVVEEYGVDRDRVVLGGWSSGAIFTYALGLAHPERFPTLLPHAGRIASGQEIPEAADGAPRLFVVHSDDDPVIPYARAQAAVERLEAAGYEVTLRTDQSGHGLGQTVVEVFDEILRTPRAPAGETVASTEEAPSPNELWTAAGKGDLAAIEDLLERGIDADARNRYGANAVNFAAEKGHLDIVQRLLDAGAEPDAEDSFYHQTALSWALAGEHFEVARLLLEAGAEKAAAQALQSGVQQDDARLVELALAADSFHEHRLEPIRAMAKEKSEEIRAALDGARVKPWQPAEVPEELLASYVASYEVRGGPRRLELTLRDGELWARDADGEPFRLVPASERDFRVAGNLSDGIEIFGRSDMVEGLLYTKGGFPLPFRRVSESGEEVTSEASGADLDAAPRGAPRNWPSFRGPNASGIADGQGAVTEWRVGNDEEEPFNVRWKTEIPGLGLSSPIVWGNRVFVNTAVSSSGDSSIRTGVYGDVDMVDDDSVHAWKLLCLDKDTGEILWERTAGEAVPATRRHLKASQANSTPATDGRHVVTVFPTLGVFCYDIDGNLLWHHDLGALDAGWFYDPSYQWGFASSPIFYRDLVILQIDVQDGAYVAAFEAATGREVWRTERDEIPTWSTPSLYLDGERDELITNGTTIRGYDPATGDELWNLAPNSEVIIATPVVYDGLIYVSAGYPPVRTIYAIRPGASGDISLTGGATRNESIAWSYDRGGAYMPTPIAYREIFYIGHHNGRLAAYDAATGEPVYRARFSQGGAFTGSPVAADGKIYFSTEEGLVYVVKAGAVYEELAINDLGEVLMSTPAISGGAIFLRTARHLYAIGSSEPDSGF